MILANEMLPILILVIVIAAFGLIAIIAYVIHRLLHPKLKDENKVDEKEAVKENLNRILEDVEDEKTAEEIANYHEEDE